MELHDADGTPSMPASDDRTCTRACRGAGTLAGIGNGNPVDVSSFQSGERTTFHGRVVAASAPAQAGPAMVEVAVDGLPIQRLRLDTVPRCADIHVPYCVLTSRITSQRRTPAAR